MDTYKQLGAKGNASMGRISAADTCVPTAKSPYTEAIESAGLSHQRANRMNPYGLLAWFGA